jgi:glycosyltransferase involved in cell wall biosynthesis
MRIAINALCQVGAGSRTYLHNVLPRLPDVDRHNEYSLLLPKKGNHLPLESADWARQFILISTPVDTYNTMQRVLYEQLVLPLLLQEQHIDILYSPVDSTTLLAPCKTVLAIRNPSPFQQTTLRAYQTMGEWFKRKALKLLSLLSAKKARRVLFVSHHSQTVIASQLGIPDWKTTIIYHGIDHKAFRSPPQELPDAPDCHLKRQRYLLCASTLNPHKNFETLIRAYSILDAATQDEYTLVIAGRISSPGYFQQLRALVQELGIVNRVRFLGEVPYSQIPALYKRASLFLFPSFLETFGHPLVEAMVAGVPIVAANSSCIPEIVDRAALLFNPSSPLDMAQQITLVLRDRELADKLVQDGYQRAEDFSWEDTVQELVDVFRTIGHDQ